MSKFTKCTTATDRLKRDYMRLKSDPLPYICAEPLPKNMLEWHFVLKGPEDTPYYGGYYHGKLEFPTEFPFKPPSIIMITPNGRFKPNQKICLNMSDYHPETWKPSWWVGTILTGLLSFMVGDTLTMGAICATDEEKKQLAKSSLKYNLNDKIVLELFPEIVTEIKEHLQTPKENKISGSKM